MKATFPRSSRRKETHLNAERRVQNAECWCKLFRSSFFVLRSTFRRVSLRRLLHVVVSVALLFVCFSSVWRLTAAEVAATTFDDANKLYEQGKFRDAAAAYQKLLQSGHASPALYFNLGNAYFKSGQMGRAVTAYRQAELITPRDPDIRANLQFARNQIQGPTISVSGWQRWLTKMSLNEWTWSGAVCLWLWFALLIVVQWRPPLRTSLKKVIITLGIVAVLVNACLLTALQVDRFTKTAVVVASEAIVRQGPLDESQTAFTVHDGAELQVLDRKDEWLQVTTDPRRIGWVRRDQVILTPQG
jgi:tetratricopeptide (TPR) repeat protein